MQHLRFSVNRGSQRSQQGVRQQQRCGSGDHCNLQKQAMYGNHNGLFALQCAVITKTKHDMAWTPGDLATDARLQVF